MRYRRLGRTGLEVSLLGLGSGGPNQFGQLRSVPRSQVVSLVRYALDLGVNFFDTAAAYADSEEILAEALSGVPRDRYLLASKFVPTRGETVISPAQARASVDKSLKRCRVGELDLLQLHRVRPQNYAEVRDRLFPELERLRDEGKVRFLGITESSRGDPGHQMLEMALADDLFDTIMVVYSPFNPTAGEKVLPLALQLDTGVIAMAVARHLLPGGRRSQFRRFAGTLGNALASMTNPRELLRRARGALSILRDSPALLPPDLQASMPGLAYRYAATPSVVSCVLSGTTSRIHFGENAKAVLDEPLSAEEQRRLASRLRQYG
jgi:aryl-alcohol dehydrogenase-like predicted oxidoreductase